MHTLHTQYTPKGSTCQVPFLIILSNLRDFCRVPVDFNHNNSMFFYTFL